MIADNCFAWQNANSAIRQAESLCLSGENPRQSANLNAFHVEQRSELF